MSEYHVRESKDDTSPKVKKAPKTASIPTPFSYFPSDDGTDENLLILLHGLGEYRTILYQDQYINYTKTQATPTSLSQSSVVP